MEDVRLRNLLQDENGNIGEVVFTDENGNLSIELDTHEILSNDTHTFYEVPITREYLESLKRDWKNAYGSLGVLQNGRLALYHPEINMLCIHEDENSYPTRFENVQYMSELQNILEDNDFIVEFTTKF